MQAWKQLGSWIAGHMVVIVPLCLVVGVFFPQALIPLKPVIPTLFAIVTFQNALQIDPRGLRDTLTRPLPLVVTLLLLMLVAPIVACLLGTLLFGSDPAVVVGLVLEYCVPVGATTIMWAGVYGGDVALALAVMLISTVISPVSIPLTLRLLVGTVVEVNTLAMIGDMLYMVGIPAVLGVAANAFSKGGWAMRAHDALAPLSRILVPIIIATNATGISEYVLHLTPRLVAITIFVGAFTVGSIACGISLARALGQPRETEVTMAFDCGIRNISAGAVLAAEFLPAESLFPVMIGTLFQQFLAALVGRAFQRLRIMDADRKPQRKDIDGNQGSDPRTDGEGTRLHESRRAD